MHTIMALKSTRAIAHLTSVFTCALLLASCGQMMKPQFNAPKKNAVALSEALAPPAIILPVDRRIRMGGIPNLGVGTNFSARMQVVSHEVRVAGAQVGGTLSISN